MRTAHTKRFIPVFWKKLNLFKNVRNFYEDNDDKPSSAKILINNPRKSKIDAMVLQNRFTTFWSEAIFFWNYSKIDYENSALACQETIL